LETALHERLDHFPVLHRALTTRENYSFTVLFPLRDVVGCLSPDYNASSHRGNGSTTADTDFFLYGPQFTLSVTPSCDYALPIPSYCDKKAKNSSTEWDEQFWISDEHYPWENKTRKAFWRGALTGLGSYHQRECLQLAMMGYSDLETMGVTFNGLDGFMTRKTRRHGLNLVRPSVPMNDFQIKCAIIDIDGNSWSERFPRLLCMNSVVIKIAHGQIDYASFLVTAMNLTAVVMYAVADEHQDVVF